MTGKLFTELQRRGKSMFKRKRRVIGKTDFGALLAKLRIDADEDLSCQAKKLRVSQSLLSMITYGSRGVSSDFALKVFRTYKNFITYEYLKIMINEVYQNQYKRFISVTNVITGNPELEKQAICDFVKIIWGEDIVL